MCTSIYCIKIFISYSELYTCLIASLFHVRALYTVPQAHGWTKQGMYQLLARLLCQQVICTRLLRPNYQSGTWSMHKTVFHRSLSSFQKWAWTTHYQSNVGSALERAEGAPNITTVNVHRNYMSILCTLTTTALQQENGFHLIVLQLLCLSWN